MPEVSELIHTRVQDHIATLCIAHPPANTLSRATVAALHGAVQSVLADAQVNVLIITGEGKLFAAGADINELAALHTRVEGEAFSRQGQRLCDLIDQAPKPVIAALNGRFALGGGWELALACHLRLAEESTQVGSPEVRLGVMVGWGASQRLPRLVGPGKALELLLTGRRLGATEAERLGLLNKVVPDGTVLQEALALAQELAAVSAPGLASILAAVQVGASEGGARGQDEEARRFGVLCESDDWHEGTRAFLEKRAARFSDH